MELLPLDGKGGGLVNGRGCLCFFAWNSNLGKSVEQVFQAVSVDRLWAFGISETNWFGFLRFWKSQGSERTRLCFHTFCLMACGSAGRVHLGQGGPDCPWFPSISFPLMCLHNLFRDICFYLEIFFSPFDMWGNIWILIYCYSFHLHFLHIAHEALIIAIGLFAAFGVLHRREGVGEQVSNRAPLLLGEHIEFPWIIILLIDTQRGLRVTYILGIM